MRMGIVKCGTVLAAVLTLAACGPKGAAEADATFPEPSASYRAVYEVTRARPGAELSPTIRASAGKQRIEMDIGGRKHVTLLDSEARTVYTFAIGDGMAKTATKLDFKELARYNFAPDQGPAVNLKKVGSDTVAGLACDIWEATRAGAPAGARALNVCVTDDGILLRAGPKDAPRMQATEVVRGAQDAALFAPPADYIVTDLGECMKVMAEYALAMRTGAAGDSAKFAACQKTIMSGRGAP